VNLYGRKIAEYLDAGTSSICTCPSVTASIRAACEPRAFEASKEIIFCEALIDALTFWCAGYRNVSTAYGTEGFTDDMLATMQRHGTQRVLIAFDRDDAGDRGTAKVSEKLIAAGIECFRILFPKGMDANEYALKVTPAAKGLALRFARRYGLVKAQRQRATT